MKASNQSVNENAEDFKNALKFFNDKESVEFTVISGDLTQSSWSNKSLDTEIPLYQANKNSLSPNTPVYPTTGNHDCPQDSDVNISTFFNYADITNIAPSDGATYSYEYTASHTASDGTVVNDHFLFLGMRRYEFTQYTYLDNDLAWLENKLESYKNDRCFIITHMFFMDGAGNFKAIYPVGNWLKGTQLDTLKRLRNNYQNSIWFSGHSHWKWYLQKYEDRANIWPVSNSGRTCGWTVHVPSCAYPIDSDGINNASSGGRTEKALQSEGAIVDVYKDYIDIRAIAFKDVDDNSYENKYLPIAQYRLYNNISQGSPQTVLHTKLIEQSSGLGLISPSSISSSDDLIVNYRQSKDWQLARKYPAIGTLTSACRQRTATCRPAAMWSMSGVWNDIQPCVVCQFYRFHIILFSPAYIHK